MAGIKVPQHEIFKISTDKLRHSKWDLSITRKEAFVNEELVPLFQGEVFRAIKRIVGDSHIDYTQYIMALEVNKEKDFLRACKKGFKVNGKSFKRFVGTTGGLKSNTVLFVSEDIYDKLYEISECGRDKTVPIIPAKLEAYRALFCSASQRIISPNKILVVSDCITQYYDDVIKLDDGNNEIEPMMTVLKNELLENNSSDGYNLCTIGYMEKVSNALGLDYTPSGVCLRNAWLKGMLYPFPIVEFFDKYMNGNYIVKDIWGNDIDIREVEMILTESSLKLWSSYKSIDDYVENYKKYGYEFAVTKISPHKLEDERAVNYQYLQSYYFSDEDIQELCEPTVKFLKDSMCGDYQSTLKFLGINGNLNDNSWQQALGISEYMMSDPYIIDSVHRMIKKKISDAKIGKLIVKGNYQILSGDPFALMQHICGLKVTGLLKAEEIYSSYWNENNVDEVCVFRSPMTSHNNIRKCKINNSNEAKYWYQYMDNIMIVNAWDSFCMACNGADFDGDICYSTNNNILLKNYRKLMPLMCVQRKAEKIIPTEDDIIKSNMNGMGNKVGQITNRATSMMDVQFNFDKGSEEWNIMTYRIACGQLYQQNELDKIKGIDFKPMPRYWFSIKDCTNDQQRLLCANKKPYFFIYNYDYIKKEYIDYMKNVESKCLTKFGISLEELLNKTDLTEEEQLFVKYYNNGLPVGFGDCAMNKICWHIENEFNGYKISLKHNGNFDYNKLKYPKKRCTEAHRQGLKFLCDQYVKQVALYKKEQELKKESSGETRTEESKKERKFMREDYACSAKEICPNDEERLNIVLDMCYGCKNNRQFCWDVVGDLIIRRLEELENNGELYI